MNRPTLIDLDPVEINYYRLIVQIDLLEFVMLLMRYLQKDVFPSERKNVNGNVFNTITRIYEAKTLIKHVSCDCKCQFDSTTCNSNQK